MRYLMRPKEKAMTIRDINTRDDLDLITDSQDVEETLTQLGLPFANIGLFVKVVDGELTEIYAFDGTIPYLYKGLEKLR